MIQVRDMLQARFGKVDQAVELFQHIPELPPPHDSAGLHFDLLTDISGSMYTVVSEYVTENLGEWESVRDRTFALPDFARWFKQFQLYFEGGRREYFQVEGPYGAWSRPGVIVVREAYRVYKWQVQTAVPLLKRYGALMVDRGVGRSPRVMTDASGPMFRAVIEIETESLSAWEEHRRSMYQEPEFQVWFVQLCNVAESGEHDFFRVEYTAGT